MSELKARSEFRHQWQHTEYLFEQYYDQTYRQRHVYRFPDFGDLNFRSGRKTNVVGLQGAAEQPADYLVTYTPEFSPTITAYMEVKSTKSTTSFGFKDIQGSQWRAAYKQVAAKGEYFFLIHAYSIGCWFKIPASHMVELKRDGRKSVSFKTLNDMRWRDMEDFSSTLLTG